MTQEEMDEKEFEKEVGIATKQFRDEQGEVPTAFAFQTGARWGFHTSRKLLREKEDSSRKTGKEVGR